jgi:hypothetical protein
LGARRDFKIAGYHWNIGAQMHYYNGFYFGEAGLENSYLLTERNGEFVEAYTEGFLRSSEPLDSLEAGAYEPALFENNGLGMSLGIEFFLRRDWSFFFSVKDLGNINWENGEEIRIDSAQVRWEGQNFREEYEGFEVTEVDSFARANNGFFESDTTASSFTQALPTTLELGVSRRWSRDWHTVLLLAKQFPEDPFRATLIAHWQFYKSFHLNANMGVSAQGQFALGSFIYINSQLINFHIGSEQLSHLFLKQGSFGADLAVGFGLKF